MTQKSYLFKCQRKKKSIRPNRHGNAPQTRKRVVKPSKVTKDMDTGREPTKFINYCNEAAATVANKDGGQLNIVKPQPESSIMHAYNSKSKDLLDWEENGNYSASSIESKLLFCKKDDFVQTAKPEGVCIPDKKPDICTVPESNILGKVKDFLGVISEANKRLQYDAKNNAEKYDLEVLHGNESEYIEMDLMLGVADLHTAEAVAAAESAMAGSQPTFSLAASVSSDDDDDHDIKSNEEVGSDSSNDEEKMFNGAGENSCSDVSRMQASNKRPKIVELS
ncbi:unnamed protein product [Coffea canephora]|uniref:DH200=94 genomic scaffold, scaffold_1330 n=1 Tax=Coffea canephora TaxID=49390 RepID=A0A068VIW6_COFCA|nr:uncharacterized protein LOC113698057 isoform X1 [Coffea arabica]CDP20534.1 unnamed protein product [Coffea canephora]